MLRRSATKASEIAEFAAKILAGDRNRTHGDKRENHENIAALWDAYAQRKWGTAPGTVAAKDVSLLMVLLKVARTMSGTHNPDDYVDAAGYAAISGELAEGDAEIAERMRRSEAQKVRKKGRAR